MNKLLTKVLLFVFLTAGVCVPGVLRAQAPVISAFSPVKGPIGTSVTISGVNFNAIGANNTVFFGATKAIVNAASATQLTVTVPVGATYQPISVLNTATHLTGYSTVPFDVTFAGPNNFTANDFTNGTNLSVGAYPSSVVSVADIDGDGKPDLLVPNLNDATISILRNTSTPGNISFAPHITLVTLSNPSGLQVRDMDGDGKPDLVVTSFYNGTMDIIRNISTPGALYGSSFAPAVTVATNYGDGYTQADIGDIDGDGKPDIILHNPDVSSFAIIQNLATPGNITQASFAPKVDFGISEGAADITIGDVDGDGKPEVVVAIQETNGVNVYKNVSVAGVITSLSLAAPKYFGSIGTPMALSIADVDQDGKPDIVEASAFGISLLRNTGSGTISFGQGVNLDTHVAAGTLAVNDMNGDGKPDYIISDYLGSGVSLVQNEATPGVVDATSFSNEKGYDTHSAAADVSTADLDGDGIPEILTRDFSNNSISIVKASNLPPPTIISFTPTTAPASATVTIIGTHFTGATAVSFGNVPAGSFIVVDDNTITATVGVGTSGDVAVVTPGGVATAPGFSFLQPPNISYQTPKVYTVNVAIAPLSPANAGGAVPPTTYGTSTYAGNGSGGAAEGNAKSASFSGPDGVMLDAAGNVYVVDALNNLIRKITPAGDVSTFAGNISSGSNDGTLTTARFTIPEDMVTDAAGNFYVADTHNNLVRKITPGGIVSTFAGSVTPGGTDGTGTAASFYLPYGITIDAAGNLYIADSGNNIIRKITPQGIVTTIAGNGFAGSFDGTGTSASFNDPAGIAIDAAGNLFVADEDGNVIRKITPAGVVTTFAGSGAQGSSDGTGTSASFYHPFRIKIGPSGNLYVTDQRNRLIRKITPAGVVTTVAGTGSQGNADGLNSNASFAIPNGLAVDQFDNLYIGDAGNNLIRYVSVNGYTIDKPLPTGLTFDPKTGIISGTPTATSPATDYTVTAYNLAGSNSTVVNIKVDNAAPVSLPSPPNISYQTPQVYTVNTAIAALSPVNSGGAVPANGYGQTSTFAGSLNTGSADGTGTAARFYEPCGITIDAANNLYISDRDNNLIRKVTPAGVVTTIAGTGAHGKANGVGTLASFDDPEGLKIDPAGNIYIADEQSNQIRKIAPDGTVTTLAGSGAQGSANGAGAFVSFNIPADVAIDAAGNVFVADKANNLIRKVTPNGNVSTFAGSGAAGGADGQGISASFNWPNGLAFDAAGNLLVVDFLGHRVRKITPGGMVSTIAGNGTAGSTNGTLANATFNQPFGITTDAAGNIYVSDFGGNMIRKISPGGIVSTISGTGEVGSADGIGTKATYYEPEGLAVDSQGNLFVVTIGGVIKKVLTTGYTIDKPLPPGLTFDYTTGNITGTPTAPSPATDYIVTAVNAGGSSSTVVNIKVNDVIIPVTPPPIITYPTPQSYTTNKPIAPLPPTNTGGAVPAIPYGQTNVLAGNPSPGAVNGTGAAASFKFPRDVVTDAAGNIYVVDTENNLIRKVTPAGAVSTFSGSGAQGSANGPAASASFMGASHIAIDHSGILYVTDSYAMIRKIAPDGTVSTVAGSLAQGHTDGPTSTATFNNPMSLALDVAGNIYVCDMGNNVIRKVTPAGVVSTFAGSGTQGSVDGTGTVAGFDRPNGIAIDADGNLYVTDSGSALVRKITPNGVVITIAGGGKLGTFYDLDDIAIDKTGNVYMSEDGNKRIYKIDIWGQLSILADNVANFPAGITVDAQANLYVADAAGNSIIKVITTGYFIDKPLPAGLNFDTVTGIITGTPTASSWATDYIITAYNAGGSGSTMINIQVNDVVIPQIPPPNISYQTPQVYPVNKVITPLQPINTGGAVPANVYGLVKTFAGNGTSGSADGAGISASFNTPRGIAIDPSGNIFIADDNNNVIRKITPAGDVSTFAGNGQPATIDGTGAAAGFNHPTFIMADKSGNLYETDGNAVRKITPQGVVTTIAGGNNPGAVNGPGATATFSTPFQLDMDASGNIYVADLGNNLIRKITPAGIVSTFAGSGVAGSTDGTGIGANFNRPTGLTVDNSGNVYVGDSGNSSIRKITPAGVVTTLAGNGQIGYVDGQGANAMFNAIFGLAVDDAGILYVADANNNVIRRVDANGNVTTVAGTKLNFGAADGVGQDATFNNPYGIVSDRIGNVYVTEATNDLVRKISTTGYTIDKPLPPGLSFDRTTGIISGTPTSMSPATNYTITAYNLGGNSKTVVNIKVNNITPPAIPPPNISYQTPQVYKVSTTIAPLSPQNTGGAVPANAYGGVTTLAGQKNTYGYADGTGQNAQFSRIWGIDKDANGNLYVSDGNRIRMITPGGNVTTIAGGNADGKSDGTGTSAGFNDPAGLAIAPSGDIFVGDFYNYSVRKVTPGGVVTTVAGGPGSGLNASGVAVDKAGNVFFADQDAEVIRELKPDGTVTIFAGIPGTQGHADGPAATATFDHPMDLEFDSDGNLFVVDGANNKVRKITPDGMVSTFAGTGGYGTTDGPATSATFNQPFAIAIDAGNNIYVGDSHNFLIRKITPLGVVSTIAGALLQKSVDGIGSNAGFDYVYGMVVDGAGHLMIADATSVRVTQLTGYSIDKPLPSGLTFDPTTGIITGTPTASSPPIDYTVTAYNAGGSNKTIVNIKVDAIAPVLHPPNISYLTPQAYIVNTAISNLAPTNTGGAVPATVYGQVSTFAGIGSPGAANGPRLSAGFNNPQGLTVDAAGNIYVADASNNKVRKIDIATGIVGTLAGNGAAGAVNGSGPTATFTGLSGLAVDANGNVFVADQGNAIVREVSAAGIVSTIAGNGFIGNTDGPANTATFNVPYNVVFDADGNLYVADDKNNNIRKIDLGGNVTTLASGFNLPRGMAADQSGNLYVADANNNTIKKVTPSGGVSVFAGSGSSGFADGTGTSATFNKPMGLCIDNAGNLYVADYVSSLIRKVSPAGVVTTIAGHGSQQPADGIGVAAAFDNPIALATDSKGIVYVTDYGNHTIRKLVVTGYTIDKPLPAGLIFDATTGTISGTPTAVSPPTDYIVTAYNADGSSVTTINIKVDAQNIIFPAIPAKTACDADFDPGATGGAPITYTSSNTAVATIVAGKVHIVGAGTSTITASDGISASPQTLTVTAAVAPSVSIVANFSADACNGLPITFVATPVNGGSTPAYQWQVNGQNAGTNSPQFMTAALNNNDKITCILTSNAACITSTTATSNQINIVIAAPVTPVVVITSSAAGPVCAGTPVTFTVTSSINVSGAIYQWQVNGQNKGTNSSAFAISTLVDGDVVTCLVSGSDACALTPNTPSNAITTILSPQNTCIINVPNAFSPNGDGTNDVWNITAIQAFPGTTVFVYNRYGSLVFSSVGYGTPWDGTSGGKPLPAGTYYYIIDPKHGKKPIAGYVAILR